MTLAPELVGTTFEPVTTSWQTRDAVVYALGIGFGQDDPLKDLQFTTDTTRDHPLVVFPTFAVVPGCAAGILPLITTMKDSADLRKMLHGEQTVEQLTPLPSAGTVETTARISAVWDKGEATILESVSEIRDASSGTVYSRTTQSLFFRGVGGWGGERGPSSVARQRPDRAPDDQLRAPTRADQALLYRLSGDPNPLHTDPVLARKAGFERPILHGLCTYGVVGRVLMARYAESDPARFVSMYARMSKPMLPGDVLTVLTWASGNTVDFVAMNAAGEIVLDKGLLELAS